MPENILENYINEIFKDRLYFGESIEKYLQSHALTDKNILDLEKSDLVKLITKAIVAIYILQSDLSESRNTYFSDMKAKTLSNVDGVEYLKDYNDLSKFASNIIENLPSLLEKKAKDALSENAKLGSAARLANSDKQKALKNIEAEFKNSSYPFHKRGYRAKFCREMLNKYTDITDIKTIERLFDKLKLKKNTLSAS